MMRIPKLSLVVFVLACAGLGNEPPLEPAAVEEAEPFGEALDAQPGQCLLDGSIVDCSAPHQDEVFSVFVAPSPLPGEEALTELASQTCDAAFEAYVGEPAPTSGYSVGWVLPDQAGESVICLLFGPGLRTGSARSR